MSDHDDPLQPHAHEPNPAPPTADPTIRVTLPNGRIRPVTLDELLRFPETAVSNCYIVSTGHGTSGPFTFSGARLRDFVLEMTTESWTQVEVVSADGFGNRVMHDELSEEVARPILLATRIDGVLLDRAAGLVRLIVPQETDDALRQVKWVREIRIRP